MSKKNSNVILRNEFSNYEDLSAIYLILKRKLNSLNKKSFLVAISGGPDSLALAALMKSYSYNSKTKIYYVLVDHNIRTNSSNEAKLVKKLLHKHKISLTIIRNKESINKNIQSKAREIRYKLLTSFCKKKKIKTILTAHNLEDQVETFFIRLSRGSGLQGLSSMKQINKIDNNVTLARPLLEFKKKNLIKISNTVFNKYFKDPTNNNSKYLRTRIRKLKQILEKSGINYDQIFKSIKNLASSRDTLELYFRKAYDEIVIKKDNRISIALKKFNNLNQEMKMRVLGESIKKFTKSYYTIRSKKIVNLIEHLEKDSSIQLTVAGCIIFKEKNRIIIKKQLKS